MLYRSFTTHLLEVRRIKLHRLVELLLLQLLFDEFLYVRINHSLLLLMRLINGIPFPPLLLLFVIEIRQLFLILALLATTVFPTLSPSLVAKAIFFLTMRFFASTKDQVFDSRLISISLLDIVHIFMVFLPDKLQELLVQLNLSSLLLPLGHPSTSSHQKIVFSLNTSWTTISNHTYFPRSQKTTAVHPFALSFIASALVLYCVV